MTDHGPGISATEAMHRRAEEFDALDAILPFDGRDQLAALLSDDDVATLKHLAAEGMGENTLRALASDLAISRPGAGWTPSPGRRRSRCCSNSSPII